MVTSMIWRAFSSRWPDLKIVLTNAVSAAAGAGWRLDKQWKRLKDEVPHLKMAPSEYIRSISGDDPAEEETENPITCSKDELDRRWTASCSRRTIRTGISTIRSCPLPPSLTDEQRRRFTPATRGAVPAGLMAKKHVVAATSEIPPGGRKLVTADGRAIFVLKPRRRVLRAVESLSASRRQSVRGQSHRPRAVG